MTVAAEGQEVPSRRTGMRLNADLQGQTLITLFGLTDVRRVSALVVYPHRAMMSLASNPVPFFWFARAGRAVTDYAGHRGKTSDGRPWIYGKFPLANPARTGYGTRTGERLLFT